MSSSSAKVITRPVSRSVSRAVIPTDPNRPLAKPGNLRGRFVPD